jgi:hypothetical protein
LREITEEGKTKLRALAIFVHLLKTPTYFSVDYDVRDALEIEKLVN